MFFPISDEGGSGGDPVNKSFIVANILIFLATLPAARYFVTNFGAVPAQISSGAALYTLITSMFLHGGLFHLLFNVWYLWIFGDNIERKIGHWHYVAFYVLAGLGGSLLHIIASPGSTVPTIGASGAISGVLGAYYKLFSHHKIDAVTTFGVLAHVKVKASWLIGAWFVIQLLFSGFSLLGATSGVAYLAHLGGFITGYLLIELFREK